MTGAKAFLFPPEEDFGLVPVEAMMYGIPVIAYKK
jgi:glycosyltransferase involved in cell wall biosynthesis